MNRVEWLRNLTVKTGDAIEIGVGQGLFSEEILKNTDFTLYSIDCWESNDFNPIPEESYKFAVNLLAPFKERSIILRSFSNSTIANRFFDRSIDLIYLDGDHFYERIKQDIEIWLPKIKLGGILSGHDYCDYMGWGVKKAVDEIFKDVRVIPAGHPDDGGQPSWSVIVK